MVPSDLNFYLGLRPLVVKYFGISHHDKKQQRTYVRMTNLLNIIKYEHVSRNTSLFQGLSEAEMKIKMPSYLDLKMGTDCVKVTNENKNYEFFDWLDS